MNSITYKKKFGQHFLNNQEVIEKIISYLNLSQDGRLVEIGPGGAALTEPLLNIVKSRNIEFKAFEIDEEKVIYLQKKFPEYKSVFILQDILHATEPFENPFVLCGNFPYNISSQILFKMIEWKSLVTEMVGMFQKEVAVRICSKEGNKDYGILSVIVQAFFDTEYLFEISEKDFIPPPKVKSAVIKCINNHNRNNIDDTKKFIKFIKSGFQFRRKTLRNNLKGIFESEELSHQFYNQRPEAISVENWIFLYQNKKHKN